MRRPPLLPLAAFAALIAVTATACVRAGAARAEPAAAATAMPPTTVPAARPAAAAPPAPTWPAIDREPELGVLIQRAPTLRIRLLQPMRIAGMHDLPAGTIQVETAGDGFRLDGRFVAGPRAELKPSGSGATFALDGATLSGSLRLARVRDQVEAIELVGMETWLAGVLPAEMHPRWPVEALGAQAIVARSYAAARWQARHGQAWHLVRGTADVAYDGAVPPSTEVAAAIAATRGMLLMHGGQAILARFHACSGGRTEDSEALWPGATLVDGRTPLSRYMHRVEDPASVEGARGLNWTRTHQQWRAAFTIDELSERLGAWSRADRRRPAIGQVVAIASAGTTPAGRVASVRVTHRTPGERSDVLEANDFRLAVGANRLRSLWWEKSVMASAKGGQWVVEGRGFGHGVGLSQVSAWWLARDGLPAADIVARFYPDATLARIWR